MRIISLAFLAVLAGAPQTVPEPPPLDRLLPARLEPVYRALDQAFAEALAMETVRFMSGYWRIAGNPGFNRSQDLVLASLKEAGLAARIDEFPNDGHGWEPLAVGLTARGLAQREPAGGSEGAPAAGESGDQAYEASPAVNSFPTGGARAFRFVDVGEGTSDRDYSGRDAAGAVVLASSPARAVWEHAVTRRGAAGIISHYLPPYNDPAAIGWESVPYDAARRAFALKVSPLARDRLAAHAAAGGQVLVDIDARFHAGPNRNLVAEIPGRSRPEERIVMVAHVQEPGANDDASGCGTLLALARALHEGIRTGAIPPPGRTLTFLWVDEIRGSEHWLKADAARAKGVQYMFSLDMTGQDTSITGGTFLIEKQPDPSAVWERPSDPHSEWGAGTVDRRSLRGSLLNDLHLAICLRRARDTGWVVRTNPYEGGSDHTVFLEAGIPALLAWHFTDRFYHTNLDTPDKVSPREMKNVGVAVAATAWLLATADGSDAHAVRQLLEQARRERLEVERRNGIELTRRGKTDAATERAVLEAWKTWYDEAIASVAALPVRAPD